MQFVGIRFQKFYEWKKVYGSERVIERAPRPDRIRPEEKQAVIEFKKAHMTTGYRRLAWMMVDQCIAAISPSSVLRILTEVDLNTRWTRPPGEPKKKGFTQPKRPHEQWHIDIAYINFRGTFLFLAAVLDGFSRAILAWEIRESMKAFDVDMLVRKANDIWVEEFGRKPRLITDNGPQFIAREFRDSLREMTIKQTRITPYHPQSNGKIERFNGTAKQEKLRVMPMIDDDQVREDFGGWIDYYNQERLHSAIDYVAPFDVLYGRREKIIETREQKLIHAKISRIEKNTEQEKVEESKELTEVVV